VLAATALVLLAPAGSAAGHPRARACVYAAHSHRTMQRFERMVGRTLDCAVVFNNAAPNWHYWERPWFVSHNDPDLNWARWATAPHTSRLLVISQSLTPGSVLGGDWRTAGAWGRYDAHFTALARNLVAAGLGRSVIRLAHEANYAGSTNPVGARRFQQLAWRRFWRRAVRAMRRVPGAHFRFDWTVNAAFDPIPLARIYPGNDVVDMVGVDAYDAGVRATRGRWHALASRPVAIDDVARFAARHHKPLSIPEWGLMPRGRQWLGGGDDPAYVAGIDRVLRTRRVAYQAYFYAHDTAAQLRRSPRALRRVRALYRHR
jgi:Glycosyl hydrolase family 26